MVKRRRLFALVAATFAVPAVALGLAWGLDPGLGREGLRVALFGGPLLELRSPAGGQILPQGGVDVLVRFPDAERVAHETFRCLLNGRDVTRELTRGENGAVGSLIGVRDGENLLRVEVFGRSVWLSRFLEDSVEVTFRVRPLATMDRA